MAPIQAQHVRLRDLCPTTLRNYQRQKGAEEKTQIGPPQEPSTGFQPLFARCTGCGNFLCSLLMRHVARVALWFAPKSEKICGAGIQQTQRQRGNGNNEINKNIHVSTKMVFIACDEQTTAHECLGCLLSTLNMGNRQQNLNYRLQNASRTFQANTWRLCDKTVSIALWFKIFDAMVTSMVCFAACHREPYVGEVHKLNVHGRKLLRRMGGTTTGYQLERTMPWHFAWVSHPHGTTAGMQWIQIVVAQMFGGTPEICKLCRFVARKQVDQTCVGLAPTTRDLWLGIRHYNILLGGSILKIG